MLVEMMQARDVTVDLYTLNSLLKACGNDGQIEREPMPSSSLSPPSAPISCLSRPTHSTPAAPDKPSSICKFE